MAASPDSQGSRALALAWLWSRSSSLEAGERVDLETLDQWRQGLLSPKRSDQVKRQLANDPRLMRMLEELVAADELLQRWDAEAEMAVPRPGAWARLRRFVREAMSRLRDPVWAGGLVAVTASLLLLVMLGPFVTAPELSGELDSVYAALEAPPEELSLPWGPKIVMRGGPRTDPDAKAGESERLAKHAFQSGMVGGMEQLKGRYPELNLNPGDRFLHREIPPCGEGDEACRQWVELARMTGNWALAVYLQCRGSPASDQPKALNLLPELQKAWRELPVGHPLGDEVKAIVAAQNPCGAVERMLRTWGR